MDIYVERIGKVITLEEWKKYVQSDKELSLSEQGKGINPLTRTTMYFEIPGRVIYKNDYEIYYENGKIGCDGLSDEIQGKLIEIARFFNAKVFDCGEEIKFD
ncbi:hypothetical protein [Enterocloster clostridioformis]|jgi:hypothetical protein|uniref:Uncharacterized protein n=2 Tax=Lachnospiraceae TaxID=186803 RepID=A0A2X2TET9_9FIRM|nr:hypothetical protein [Enterocloster clostridioformis]MCA5579312.1 hypothetical protein [Enterocloster clostridioformis]SQB04202.1 Uncharacterised protein [Enterocloster clostridioformis]